MSPVAVHLRWSAAWRRRAVRAAACGVAVLPLLAGAPTGAQPPSQPKSYRLELKPDPKLPNGTIAVVQGTAAPAGHRFFAENLSILQPVAVALFAESPDDDIRLQLSKYTYEDADRQGSTAGEGHVTFKVRTEGELKILVSGEQPRPYYMTVWAGDPLELPMSPVLVSRETLGEGSGGSGSMVLWIIAGLLVCTVALLAVIVFRGRKA